MFTVPKKVENRISEGIKKFKRILANAKKKDLNESDTVMIITDLLDDILGYDKYSEVTSEYAIRGTYCDLAVRINDKIKILIECKAIGLNLKEDHVKQSVDYGANEGIDWVVLTNGDHWKVFKIAFKKPITKELVYEFSFEDMKPKSKEDIEHLYCLSKESTSKSKTSLAELYEHKSMLNKYMLGQLILDESTISHLRRLLKKVSPDIKITSDDIMPILENEVLKREILDPEEIKDAKRLIKRKLNAPKPKAQNEGEVYDDSFWGEERTFCFLKRCEIII
jgi:hypothetical protein